MEGGSNVQIYLVENIGQSIRFITDTFDVLEDVAKKHPKESWIITPIEMKISDIDMLRSKYIQESVEKIEPKVIDVLKYKHKIDNPDKDVIRSIAKIVYDKNQDGFDLSCAIDETIEDNERIAELKKKT